MTSRTTSTGEPRPRSTPPYPSAQKHEGGFYNGFATRVAIPGRIIVARLTLWPVVFPQSAGTVLTGLDKLILANFAISYIYVMAGFVLTCLLAAWPELGRMRLGADTDRPGFDNFSWFSMMFGAGIGVGMLTWAVAEPIYHFGKNPWVIKRVAGADLEDNVLNAHTCSFLHFSSCTGASSPGRPTRSSVWRWRSSPADAACR